MPYSFISMSQVYDLAVSGSGGIPSGALGGYVTQSFTSSQTWSFSHNLGSQFVSFEIFDTDYNVIIPEKIVAANSNTALIYFPITMSGIAAAGFAGYVYNATSVSSSYSLSSSYSQTSSYAIELQKPTVITIACSDEVTQLQTGSALTTFYMPYDMVVSKIKASLTNSGSTSSSINVLKNGNTVFSSSLIINAFSYTGSQIPTTSLFLSDDRIQINLNSAGIGATGLKIYVLGH